MTRIRGSARFAAPLAALALPLLTGPLLAQHDRGGPSTRKHPGDPALPPAYHQAMAEGDTLAAIRALESALTLAPPDRTVVEGELGILLAYTAPEVETDFTQRLRARRLLEDALKKDPGNPRYFLALGVVLEKGMMRVDARVALDRGLEAARERPSAISDRELADAFYHRGRALEVQIEELDGLRNVPADEARLGTLGCQVPGEAFCLNWTRPRRFIEHFRFFPDVSELAVDDRAAMEREYRRAVEVDPGHDGAWRGLLRSLAARGRWDSVAVETRRWQEAEPENPWTAVFLGLADVRDGPSWEAAEAHFRAGLESLEDRDRAVFLDLTPLLPSRQEEAWARLTPGGRDAYRRSFFLAQDPLLLTEANEREAAHYARVAEAELRFGEPQVGRRGWETDRGRILVRYGPPQTVWQARRDDRGILTTEGLSGAPTAGPITGGRWIFWNYDPEVPSFVFEKMLGRTRVTHMVSSQSMAMARDLKAESPAAFTNPFEEAGPLPFQAARFRSLRRRRTDLEVHAQAPLDGLASDSIHTGFFLHRTSNWEAEVEARGSQAGDDPGVDFRVTGLGPGVYRYSLEAATADRSRAATHRGELLVHPQTSPALQLSDLLIAHDVVATVREPGARPDLSVDPLRCLTVPEDGDFWVVFEVYGLSEEDDVARYRIDLKAGGGPEGWIFMRFLRGVARPFLGPGEEGRSGLVSYERRVQAREGRAVEWFEVALPENREGSVDLELTVTDLGSGATASSRRSLPAEGCAPGA